MRPLDPSHATSPRIVLSRDTVPRILLLGGTGDALAIARQLGRDDCYSIAGLGIRPLDLPCGVREGGFGGVDGLTQTLLSGAYGLLIDATHPYAARISANALAAATHCRLPYWRLERPAWTATSADRWIDVDDWPQTHEAVSAFRRPLWTLGREPLAHTDAATCGQHWFVRCLPGTAARHAEGRADTHTPEQASDRAAVFDVFSVDTDYGNVAGSAALPPCITVLPARGPFTLTSERALIASLGIDVIVSKNSGGSATDAKLQAARELGLPIIMRRRPPAPWENVADSGGPSPRENAASSASPRDTSEIGTQAADHFADQSRRPVRVFDSAEAVLHALPPRST